MFFGELLFAQQTQFNSALVNLNRNIKLPPPPHHQVNYKLTCCHNYEGYEGGQSGQDEDRGGVFRYGKGRRDGRYQRGRKQKDEEVDVGMCTVIIMILKDVSQHGVSVPNNIGGNYPLAGIHVDIDGKYL